MITVDTNIFVYASQASEGAKPATAIRVLTQLARLRAPLALQVVGEFQHVARRKLGFHTDELVRLGEDMLTAFDVFPATASAVRQAIGSLAARQLSYWDALLLASASEAGCRTFLSEDMGDGDVHFGVRVVNPFGPGGMLAPSALQVLGL